MVADARRQLAIRVLRTEWWWRVGFSNLAELIQKVRVADVAVAFGRQIQDYS